MLAKYILLAVAAFGSIVAAQTSTKCADQVGFDKCIEITTATTKSCVGTGYEYYKCLCDAHKTVLGCYDRCPNLPEKGTQQNTVVSFCQAADQYRPVTSTPTATRSDVTAAPSATGSQTVTDKMDIQTSTPTASPTGGNGTDPSGNSGAAAGLSPLASLGFVAAGAIIAGFF
ncbi:hypothetical protein DFH27DRAFT_606063 [Peziza echinospora]|nr:hypothetical protein DFH27DRAFT_606063 [Peziza echinospora]